MKDRYGHSYGMIGLDMFRDVMIEKIERKKLLEQSERLAIENQVIEEFKDLKEFLTDEEFTIAVREEVKERFKLCHNAV